ncbi:MAG TPA: hypothetical protein PLF25_11325, partial [Accumulibacter sp.]|nr:hypothetical protein [Accumulibacter sp.]
SSVEASVKRCDSFFIMSPYTPVASKKNPTFRQTIAGWKILACLAATSKHLSSNGYRCLARRGSVLSTGQKKAAGQFSTSDRFYNSTLAV